MPVLCFSSFPAVCYLPFQKISKDVSPEIHLYAKWVQFFYRKWEFRHRRMRTASSTWLSSMLSPTVQLQSEVVVIEVCHDEAEVLLCGMSSPSSGPGSNQRNTVHSDDIHKPPASIPDKAWIWENQDIPFHEQVRCHLDTVAWQQTYLIAVLEMKHYFLSVVVSREKFNISQSLNISLTSAYVFATLIQFITHFDQHFAFCLGCQGTCSSLMTEEAFVFYKLFGTDHKELKVSGWFSLYIYHVPNSDAVEIDS